ncbi:lysophospholipid acyltransferase family protein [Cryptosporangium phraense]|uniref:1-acyl-sn-glycerol-3-phosphate acyltransferase n=1 Tax=Cryptosporangium phraense TaxID=2593070 RepID=A0A545ATC3_9ACTN|nr:lysophospholipid acyltransferase family protein [Cryptosporangium phraense]TQS44587.1 1-acyl-sn-glycerol-3-phosphate acyltransferase [Cryptosporangium phraense]
MFYWVCKYILIGPFLRLFFRPVLEGVENIPATGPVILASNHLSFSDSFFFPLMVPRRIVFLAKSEYFTGKGVKGMFSRLFFSAAGCVPIDRTSGSAAEAALTTGARVLAEGHPLGIYPEGTRSPDGKLYRGKTGVARLALQTGVPVVPVAMINTDQVQPIGQLIPRIMRVRMRVGKPLDFSRYAGLAGNRFVERSVTDQIMYDLMQLSGQQYVDVYAASVKNNTTPADAGQRAAESVAA